MTTVINIHKDSFMFMTGVMSCLWQCHLSLISSAPSLLFHLSSLVQIILVGLCHVRLPAWFGSGSGRFVSGNRQASGLNFREVTNIKDGFYVDHCFP